jgi:hypothetical protein
MKKINKNNKEDFYRYLYLAYHAVSGLFKIGVSNDPVQRIEQINGKKIRIVDFKNINALDFENKIKAKYKYFNLSSDDAKARGVPPSGSSEYYKVNKDMGEYMLDWSRGRGKQSKWALSPFSKFFITSIYPNKEVHQRNPQSLLSVNQYRSAQVSPKHLKNIKDAVEVDGEVKEPLLVNSISEVEGGTHRLLSALALNLPSIPVKIVDEIWMGKKELKDAGVMLNNNEHNSINLPNSSADIQNNMMGSILEYMEYTNKSFDDSVDHFNEVGSQEDFVNLFHITKASVTKNYAHAILKLNESRAVGSGIFKPIDRDSKEVKEAIKKANKYYNNKRVIVVHVAEKFSDALGHCITKMINKNSNKGLIITYKSFRNKQYSNYKDLKRLGDLKHLCGLDIALQEIDQTTSRASKISFKEGGKNRFELEEVVSINEDAVIALC